RRQLAADLALERDEVRGHGAVECAADGERIVGAGRRETDREPADEVIELVGEAEEQTHRADRREGVGLEPVRGDRIGDLASPALRSVSTKNRASLKRARMTSSLPLRIVSGARFVFTTARYLGRRLPLPSRTPK